MNAEPLPILDFTDAIRENYYTLTRSEKHVADFLLKNQEDAAFMAAGDVAKQLRLSEATLVRFACQ